MNSYPRYSASWFLQLMKKPETIHEWTDEMCLIEGQTFCVWKNISENEVEGHLINFVNLWFAGDNKSSDEIVSTIRNVLLLTPLGISNDLQLLRNVLDSALEIAQTPPAIKQESILREPIVSHFEQKEKADVFAFHKWLKQNLVSFKVEARKISEVQPHSPEYHLVSQKLRVVIGFCALLLMRLLTKNVQQFKRYFPHAASKTFNRLFPEARLDVLLVTPAPKSLEKIALVLSSNSDCREDIDLLYLLVFQYLKSTSEDDRSSRLTREILEEGCLKVLEGNGMGLVTLFQDVTNLYPNIEKRKLLSTIAENWEDKQSLERLNNFLNIYAQSDKPLEMGKNSVQELLQ